MNDHHVHRDDVTAMRSEGDLKTYMRQLRAAGRARLNITPSETRTAKWAAIPKPPDHKPGQWPPGTSPPGPSPERSLPPELWAAATRHHSNEINRPDQPCDCGNCPPDDRQEGDTA
jgi:hypothetical protein